MRALGAEIVDPVYLDRPVVENFREIRRIADYRFGPDWEEYLTRFGPNVPKTVQEFVDLYETEVAQSEFPVADSILNMLKTALVTSTDAPEYIDLIDNVLPAHTDMTLAPYEQYNLDALVFPYHPTFASPINSPVYQANDPDFVDSNVLPPATVATYNSVGLPGIVVPMGFGSLGLPMDISFMGRPMEEGKLIGFAYDYEQATHHRRPSPLLPALPGEVIDGR
jgi:amidase